MAQNRPVHRFFDRSDFRAQNRIVYFFRFFDADFFAIQETSFSLLSRKQFVQNWIENDAKNWLFFENKTDYNSDKRKTGHEIRSSVDWIYHPCRFVS